MRSALTIPSCMLAAAKLLFPTLDFGKLVYFLDDIPVGAGHANATTVGTVFRTELVFRRKLWENLGPCSTTLFRLLCHELVHALQVQELGGLFKRATSITCKLLHGSDSGNCLEKEALDYEGLLLPLLDGVPVGPGVPPCLCVGTSIPFLDTPGFGVANPAFAAAVAASPGVIKRTAGCSPWDCVSPGFWGGLVGYPLVGASFVFALAGPFVSEGTIAEVGTWLGAASGATAGGAAGYLIAGPIGAAIGVVIGAIVGAIVGGLVGAAIQWLARAFGTEGGALNLMFSTDGGLSFGSKVSFDRSTQPMSLAFGKVMIKDPPVPNASPTTHLEDRLCIAWTGTDERLNLVTVPQNTRIDFEQSESCGPAVVQNGVRLLYLWQGADNHLNGIATWDGVALQNRFTLPETSPNDASPAITAGFDQTGDLFLSWIGGDNAINLMSSKNGVDWGHKITLNEAAGDAGTAALAWVGNTLIVAWAGTDQKLNVLQVDRKPDGTLVPGFKTTLSEYASDDSGPALAFGAAQGLLFLAWTGTDGQVSVMRSRDRGRTFIDKSSFEKSRTDCGPALAVHDDGTVCVGWTGED